MSAGQLVCVWKVQLTAQTRNIQSCATDALARVPTVVFPTTRSCANPDSQKYYVALENLLKQYLGKCFQTNFTQNKVRCNVVVVLCSFVFGTLPTDLPCSSSAPVTI